MGEVKNYMQEPVERGFEDFARSVQKDYHEDQPRDEHGQWTSGGGGYKQTGDQNHGGVRVTHYSNGSGNSTVYVRHDQSTNNVEVSHITRDKEEGTQVSTTTHTPAEAEAHLKSNFGIEHKTGK